MRELSKEVNTETHKAVKEFLKPEQVNGSTRSPTRCRAPRPSPTSTCRSTSS